MNNLWQKAGLSLFLFSSTTALSLSSSDYSIAGNKPENVIRNNFSVDHSIVAELRQSKSFCESLGDAYQEHYSFETHNYNVSICRRGADWYYYRKSKSEPNSALLIPARSVFDEDTFKAVDGKVTYFVGINSDGYYSSVMYGNNRLIFEPELTRNIESTPGAGGTTSVDYKRGTESSSPNEPTDSDKDKLDSLAPELNLNYWQICTEDSEDLHPELNGWQRFIGDPAEQVHSYVASKGYKLVSKDEPNQVAFAYKSTSVETDSGLLVTLGVLRLTNTVTRVCVEPTTSF